MANIMSRKQAFRHVFLLGAAMMAGREPPAWPAGLDVVEAEDMADAMRAFTRTLADSFDHLPDMASDDLALQEQVRCALDSIFSDLAVETEAAIERLRSA